MPMGQCHNVDMYGIYTVCDTPGERHHEERPQTIVEPVYVTIPEPMMPQASAPNPFPTPAPAPARTLDPEPPPVATEEGLRRVLTWVDDRLHRLHLLLNDKHASGEITADFFDEELRILAQIERREQSASDANGGYLTVAQENLLIQNLQDVENEIHQTYSNQG